MLLLRHSEVTFLGSLSIAEISQVLMNAFHQQAGHRPLLGEALQQHFPEWKAAGANFSADTITLALHVKNKAFDLIRKLTSFTPSLLHTGRQNQMNSSHTALSLSAMGIWLNFAYHIAFVSTEQTIT